MKKTKVLIKLTALTVCMFILCVSFASCSIQKAYEGAPDGMRPINDGSIGATVYVPSSWCVDASLGVPMGYVSSTDRTMVTLIYVSETELNGRSLSEYWLSYKDEFTASMTDFTIIKDSDDAKDYTTRLIAGADAYEFEFTATVTGLEYHFRQAIIRGKNNDAYLLTYSAFEDNYETHIDVLLDDIYDNFAFTTETISVEDDNTVSPGIDDEIEIPDGMQLISNKAVDYIMFVPSDWCISVNTGVSAAYVSSEDKTSVSAVAFDTDYTSLDDFWNSYSEDIVNTFGNIEYTDTDNKYAEVTIDGYQSARCYNFSVTARGVEYRYSENVLLRDGYIYIITFCSEASMFESHISEFDLIISNFSFK